MAGRGRSSSPPVAGPRRSQHYLSSRRLATELVHAAELRSDDLVVEFGAGFGRLTEELASTAGRVVAVEVDGRLAARLGARFETRDGVRVLQQDALTVPLPSQPFRVLSNPPFHLTSRLLGRLLDDPRVPLVRADLVLDWRAAIGLTAVHPPSRQSMGWQPWFEFLLLRRLPAAWFAPEPAVDAALVSIRRRQRPLLAVGEAAGYRRWLRRRADREDVWGMVRLYRGGRAV